MRRLLLIALLALGACGRQAFDDLAFERVTLVN